MLGATLYGIYSLVNNPNDLVNNVLNRVHKPIDTRFNHNPLDDNIITRAPDPNEINSTHHGATTYTPTNSDLDRIAGKLSDGTVVWKGMQVPKGELIPLPSADPEIVSGVWAAHKELFERNPNLYFTRRGVQSGVDTDVASINRVETMYSLDNQLGIERYNRRIAGRWDSRFQNWIDDTSNTLSSGFNTLTSLLPIVLIIMLVGVLN